MFCNILNNKYINNILYFYKFVVKWCFWSTIMAERIL